MYTPQMTGIPTNMYQL